jgi:hypothetical protein
MIHQTRLNLNPKMRPLGKPFPVDDFVAAKALGFNKVQQSSTSRPQTVQQQLLRNNKNP